MAIDVVVSYNGVVGDNAATYAVGNVSPKIQQLLAVTEQSLRLAIEQARVGNRS